MPPLKTFRPGESLLNFDSATWNAFVQAELDRRRRAGTSPGAGTGHPTQYPPATFADFKYDASESSTLPAFSVVKYGAPVIDIGADDGEHVNQASPAFLLLTPDAADNQVAVTVEPIVGGTLGRAVTSGLAVCTVDVGDEAHGWAVPIDGDSTKFDSAASGGYPIVWKESGTGDVWAVVLVGPVAAAGADPAAWSAEGSWYDVVSGTISVPNEPGNYMYLELPAGQYLVTGTGWVGQNTTASAYIGLQVWDAGTTRPTTGTMVGGNYFGVPTTSGIGINVPFVVSAALDLSADSWVAIGYRNLSGSVSVNSSHLCAVRVGSITAGGIA